jgi:O-antigen ligase
MISEIVLEPLFQAKPSRGARAWTIAAASGFALAVAIILNTGDYKPLLAIVLLGTVVAVTLAVPYTVRHSDWLIFVLALIYLLISISFLDERTRGVVHYGLLLLFIVPVLSKLYRSDLWKQGGFRLYCCYFAWALVTVVYSLAPAFSLGRLLGSFLGFSALLVCTMGVNRAEDAQRLLLRFFMACAVLVALTLIAGVILPHSLTWQTPESSFDAAYIANLHAQGIGLGGMDRFRGIFGNPNDIGALMLITVSSALTCWRSATRFQRLVLAMVATAAAGTALRADSRSAFVALAVGAGMYALWRYRMRGVIAAAIAVSLVFGAMTMIHGFGDYATRGADTLTGRTDIWAYALQQVRERPILGYGYEVSGAIFASRYFPLWYGPWDMGPHSSLHDGYLVRLIGVGIPATLVWLFIVLRPWVFIFRQTEDPWNLKPVALFVVVPAMIYNLTEAAIGDFFGVVGILFGLVWVLAELYRLQTIGRRATEENPELRSSPFIIEAFR